MAKRPEIQIKRIRQVALNEMFKKKKFVDESFDLANSYFQEAKQELLNEFDNHEITQELKAGAFSGNDSSTLEIAREETGNLFSFFGFPGGSDPTAEVREVLDENTRIIKTARGARYQKDFIKYSFPVVSASVDGEIVAVSSLPFDSGKSWVLAVEGRGFSDINSLVSRYLYDSGKVFPSSRSGPAIQVDGVLGSYKFKPQPYLSRMIENFKNKFR